MSVVILAVSTVVTFLAILIGYIYIRVWRHGSSKTEHSSQPGCPGTIGNEQSNIQDTVSRQQETVLANKTPWTLLDQDPAVIKPKLEDGTDRDPLDYCNHIQREVKKTKQRIALQKIESEMTKEQRDQEREIQRQQLQDIFKLLEDQKDDYGVTSVDDIQQQMKLYIN